MRHDQFPERTLHYVLQKQILFLCDYPKFDTPKYFYATYPKFDTPKYLFATTQNIGI